MDNIELGYKFKEAYDKQNRLANQIAGLLADDYAVEPELIDQYRTATEETEQARSAYAQTWRTQS